MLYENSQLKSVPPYDLSKLWYTSLSDRDRSIKLSSGTRTASPFGRSYWSFTRHFRFGRHMYTRVRRAEKEKTFYSPVILCFNEISRKNEDGGRIWCTKISIFDAVKMKPRQFLWRRYHDNLHKFNFTPFDILKGGKLMFVNELIII